MSATSQQQPDSDSDSDWSAPKLVALGAVILAIFFVFIYNVSP